MTNKKLRKLLNQNLFPVFIVHTFATQTLDNLYDSKHES